MELSFIFRFLNAIKFLHWSTQSYAEHKALDDAYSTLSAKLDEFVECFKGLKPEAPLILRSIDFEASPSPEEFATTLDFFNALSHDFLNNIERYNDTDSFTSMIDEMENCIFQVKYLLGFKA